MGKKQKKEIIEVEDFLGFKQKIIKEVYEGEIIYRLKHNNQEVHALAENIFETLETKLIILDSYFDMLTESYAEDNTPAVGKIVLDDVRRTLNEIQQFVETKFGTIEIEATIHQRYIKGNQPLAVVFEPIN